MLILSQKGNHGIESFRFLFTKNLKELERRGLTVIVLEDSVE
jgi:hypothetical protein